MDVYMMVHFMIHKGGYGLAHAVNYLASVLK